MKHCYCTEHSSLCPVRSRWLRSCWTLTWRSSSVRCVWRSSTCWPACSRTTRSRCWPRHTRSPSTPRTCWTSSTRRGWRCWLTTGRTSSSRMAGSLLRDASPQEAKNTFKRYKKDATWTFLIEILHQERILQTYFCFITVRSVMFVLFCIQKWSSSLSSYSNLQLEPVELWAEVALELLQ